MSKTNLAIYYPIVYKGVHEIDQLVATENVMFDELDNLTTEAEENQFILTSNSRGLEVYEKMLDIIANPESDSIQFRRERLINRLSAFPPFTLRELKRRLNNLLGSNNYDIEVIYDDYELKLDLKVGVHGKLDEVLRTLISIVPVNMLINPRLIYNRHSTLSQFTHGQLRAYTHNQLRRNPLKIKK
jgi:hypothetical protein